MSNQKRTAAALKALKAKRSIPDGLASIQLTIQLRPDLVAHFRSLSPVKRGEIIEAGLKAIDRLENLGEIGNE